MDTPVARYASLATPSQRQRLTTVPWFRTEGELHELYETVSTMNLFSSAGRLELILALILIGACNGSDDDALKPEPAAARVQDEAAQPIYLTDLDRSQPQSSLSRKWKRGTWRLLDYTGERGSDGSGISQMHDAFEQKPDPDRSFTGTLLVATDGNQAPEIAYSPARSG